MARRCTQTLCVRFMERHLSTLNFALLVVGYILYLLIGAGIFSAIELPYEQELRQELAVARQDFLSNNTCVSDARLEELLVRALEANNYGVSVLGNDTSRNWDFVSSLFFTSTVLTTTGEARRRTQVLKLCCTLWSLMWGYISLDFIKGYICYTRWLYG